ncbi:MAG: tRNA lysidine(34) synthetase TilS [Clostridia bacterium]|nr:tRNA lysidine(34) synthetase TilS [Clostridia bacterium]
MKNKFLRAIKQFNMLSAGDAVCVGVSGGADSMCLLHLLYSNKDELQITVSAVHINHCIRGKEADDEERYVREYCERNNIPLTVERIDVPALSRERKESTELCARKARYDCFSSSGADKIATAHTGSDCIETALMNLSRGSSLHGLCSIPPVRGNIIRPLIFFTREDTERYCEENAILYVTDSSNLSDDYTRNKFRHNVISPLKSITPAFESNALRCIELLRDDDSFLSEIARKEFERCFDKDNKTLCCQKLNELHSAIKSRVVALYFSFISDADYEMRHIKMLCDNSDKDFSVTLPSGVVVCCNKKTVYVQPYNSEKSDLFSVIIDKQEKNQIEIFNKKFDIYPSDSIPDESCLAVLDFDKIGEKLCFRFRLGGDEIFLKKRRCTKTLKKLFSELKIPREEREKIPVLAQDNTVVWIDIENTQTEYYATQKTKKYLIIKNGECQQC